MQLSLNYEEYEMHRHLHDNLRNVTIPALDKDLEENRISQSWYEISLPGKMGIKR